MALLKQSTAYNRMFFMIDSASRPNGKTGLSPTVTISKNAGTFAAAGGTVSEVANGWYQVQYTTTDTNTLGMLVLHATGAGADAAEIDDQVFTSIPGDAVTLTSAYDFAKGTTAVAEAYAANGVSPTPVQALMAIHQMLMSFAISGTSISVKKLDNTTAAFSATLNSSTSPTQVSRS